jgi:serine/threonine protein kinase
MATAGERIDKFTLVRQLGAGGMGSTWEAVRQVGRDFEQRVAIKVAEPDLLRTADGVASFRREAALAASLRHPNIAAVLDVDEKAGYIVCELVDGADLRAVLRAAPGGRLEPSIVVHVIAQMARGLSHAHRRILRGRPSPVIHRDMSPGNVVIDYDGNAKIVDFGIAKVLATGAEIAESVKGKLSYMAPEQAMGGRMDGRVDQYALGVIAYEALCGLRPNDRAHDGETLACILEGKHVPLFERVAGLPHGLYRVIERMLALRPADRYENMESVLDALAEFTPRLTVHRSLVPLVMAAHQPHTIVSENGRFVSRPVEGAPLWTAEKVAEVGAHALRAGSAGRRMPPSGPALAVTLGNTQPAHNSLVPPLTAARPAPPPLPVAPVPLALPTPPVRKRSKRRRTPHWLLMSATALCALLLAVVTCLAFFPQSLQQVPQLVPVLERLGFRSDLGVSARAAANQLVRPAPVAPSTAKDDGATGNGAGQHGSAATTETTFDALTVPPALPDGVELNVDQGTVRRDPAKHDQPPAQPALKASTLARVRVHVQPPAKVWLDDQPSGDAKPELELNIPAGAHVIGVGDEHGQVQRRNVELTTDKLNVVRFELEEQ